MSFAINNTFKIILLVLLMLGLLFLKETLGNAEPSAGDSYPMVELSRYGSLEKDSIQTTFQRAVSDLNGKKLVILK